VIPAGAWALTVKATGIDKDPPEFEATTEKDCVDNALVGVPENTPVLVLKAMPAAKRVDATEVLRE
jgi:hypothetical protein